MTLKQAPPPGSLEERGGSNKKVLIVDDEPAILKALELSLKIAGFETVKATNGEEGLQAFKEDPHIAVVMTDTQMPKMSGTTMAEKIKEHAQTQKRDVGIMMMSGNPTVIEYLLETPNPNIDEILSKPFTQDQFMPFILKRLRQKE